MDFRIGDRVTYFKRQRGGIYRRVERIEGVIVRIGRMMTIDCGVRGVYRANPENLQKVVFQ